MKQKGKNRDNGVVVGKREFRVLVSTKLEERALKKASRSLAGRSYNSIKEQSN